MIVIVAEEVRKERGALIAGAIGAGIGPLAGDGLDKAFGLAVGLGAIGTGEAVLDASLVAGSGEEF